MPAASPTRQPESPTSWFDGGIGRAFLDAELGLMMPLLLRRPGLRMCWILPSAASAERAPPMLMPGETRLWREGEGWYAGDEPVATLPQQEMDLVVAAHVMGAVVDAKRQIDSIYAMLRPGRAAFFVELNPWSPFRWQWRGCGLHAPSVRRLTDLVRRSGLTVEASYALNPSASRDSVGTLLRHDWRTPAWLPHRAFAIRAQRREPGMTAVGATLPAGLALGASGA